MAGENCKCQAADGQGPQWNDLTSQCCSQLTCGKAPIVGELIPTGSHYPGPNHQVSYSCVIDSSSLLADELLNSVLLLEQIASTLVRSFPAARASEHLVRIAGARTRAARMVNIMMQC